MPNLRSKTWTTTTPAYVEDAQFWEDHLISDAVASKAASSVQTVNSTAPDANGNVDVVALPAGGTVGQVLTKKSSTDGDADWENPASSGHTIKDEDGVSMTQQPTLQFLNADVTNDSVNSKTVVDCKGSKGDPGQAATITVGTVTTLPAGSSATVTNSGTSSAAVFNFGIPKGADGSGAGDMLKADYDPNSVVELAGGIPDYVASQAYTLPTAASNVLGGVKVGTNLSIDANGVLSATDTNTDALRDLTDVNISLPSDGQALLYNSTSGKWENGDVAGSAADISYDNTSSGLTADDVQEAIDEIDSNIDTLDDKVYKTDDSTETTIASDDLLPIYDTSATAAKKITVENVVKATVSNPNLIDNPWFTVNQRGSNNYTADGYCVDRWYELNADVAVSDSGVTITKRSGAQYEPLIRQLIIPTKDLRGKTVTLSISVTAITANGGMNLYKASGINNDLVSIGGISFTTTGKYTVTASIPNDVGGSTYPYLLVGIDSYGTDCSLSVESVKLELGSISTLAMDTAPNYSTELLKCQRYFIRIATSDKARLNFNCMMTVLDGAIRYVFISGTLPTVMRTTPIFSTNDITKWFVFAGHNNAQVVKTLSALAIERINANNVFLGGITDSTDTEFGQYGQLWSDTANCYLDFSADL